MSNRTGCLDPNITELENVIYGIESNEAVMGQENFILEQNKNISIIAFSRIHFMLLVHRLYLLYQTSKNIFHCILYMISLML